MSHDFPRGIKDLTSINNSGVAIFAGLYAQTPVVRIDTILARRSVFSFSVQWRSGSQFESNLVYPTHHLVCLHELKLVRYNMEGTAPETLRLSRML